MDFKTAEELMAFICIFGREIRFGILSLLFGKDIYLMPPNILFTAKKVSSMNTEFIHVG
jgi:hypothetical protein